MRVVQMHSFPSSDPAHLHSKAKSDHEALAAGKEAIGDMAHLKNETWPFIVSHAKAICLDVMKPSISHQPMHRKASIIFCVRAERLPGFG